MQSRDESPDETLPLSLPQHRLASEFTLRVEFADANGSANPGPSYALVLPRLARTGDGIATKFQARFPATEALRRLQSARPLDCGRNDGNAVFADLRGDAGSPRRV